MKRRKKLWIACAALALVVALCAFALVYRPEPYRFLKGATLERVSTGPIMMSVWPSIEHTHYYYVVSGSLDAVVAKARQELTAEKGWECLSGSMGTESCNQLRGSEYISFAARWHNEGDPPCVTVTVSHETGTIDRFHQWLHDR